MNSRQSRTSWGPTLFLPIILSALCLLPAARSWGWNSDPAVNTGAFLPQLSFVTPPHMVEDGAGGVVVTTGSDTGAPESTGIYTRRLNANGEGNDAWPAGGVVQQVPAPVDLHQSVTDGAGGTIVVWVAVDAYGSGDIYAQRYDALGRAQWPAGGIAVCRAAEDQSDPQVVPDGAGGAVVVWNDLRSGNYSIYAQRLDSTGNALWQADGVAVSQGGYDKLFPQLIGDGDAVFVVWQDYRKMVQTPDAPDIGADLYAQSLDPNGNLLWPADVAVSAAVNDQIDPVLAEDGAGGVIVAWEDYRDDPTGNLANVYAQRLDDTGTMVPGQWVADGLPVAPLPGADQQFAQVATDGADGAYLVWQDDRAGTGNYQAYAQHLVGDGSAVVPGGGLVSAEGAATGYTPKVLPDGSGQALVVWRDYRNDPDTPSSDLYAQLLDGALLPAWGLDLAVSTAAGEQMDPVMVSDGAGGAIVAWQDYRNGLSEIYLERIGADGTLSSYTTPSYNQVFQACWPGYLVGEGIQTVTEGGSAATVQAMAYPHYHFVQWNDESGQPVGSSAPLTVSNVTRSQIFTAVFAIDSYSVKFNAGPGGQLIGTDSQTVEYGGSTSAVTAAAGSGYHFVNWTDAAGNVIGSSASLTVTNVAVDQSVLANFAQDAVVAPPGVPSIVSVSAANGEATVTFTPPASSGSSPITGYTVTANPGNITASGTRSPITVTGLSNGTAYTFTVSATSQAGTGTASSLSASVTPLPTGDLNGDGQVNVADALLALRMAVKFDSTTSAALARADVAPLVGGKPQSDGTIDVGDAVVILRRSVGAATW